MTATADRGSAALAGLRVAGLAAWFLACLVPHLLSKLILRHSRWPRRFLAGVAWIAGARVTLTGPPPARRTLLLANHTSWLDIVVLAGATGTSFVSKAEIGGVALIGWLADQNHTLYVDRAARRDSHRQIDQVRAGLDRAWPLAIFPEGTTGDGTDLLTFRSTLLSAVAPPPPGVAVQPVAIDYGAATAEIAWHGGEAGLANVRRVLGRRSTIPVTVQLLDPLPVLADRKLLADQARAAIAAALPSICRAPPPHRSRSD